MKLPPLVVTEPDKNSPIRSACQCVGQLYTGLLLSDDVIEVHGPWLIPILAHFYERHHAKLFYLMASLLFQGMVVCVGCDMPVMVHKEIDVVRHLPHSVCLWLGLLSADLGQLLRNPCTLSVTLSYAAETTTLWDTQECRWHRFSGHWIPPIQTLTVF